MASVRPSPASPVASVNALISGTAWAGPLGYGFSSALSAGPATAVDGRAPSAALNNAVAATFRQIGEFTNLNATAARNADIRVVEADALAFASGQTLNLGAYAFFPGHTAIAGDAVFGRSVTGDLSAGSYGFRTVLHEIGHALGLKHPHERGPYGALPAHLDSQEFSVMSVRSEPGAPLSAGLGTEPGGFAETYMPADIAALQHLYGANFSSGAHTRYVFDPFERIMLRTIWDGGGHDTYDFSRYAAPLAVSLAPGDHSRTGQEPQLNRAEELSTGAAPVRADGAIHNAFLYRGRKESLIEDAIGGSGGDTITGNIASNLLDGRAGDDLIRAGGGRDRLLGGSGADTLSGDAANDRLFGNTGADALHGGAGNDLIVGGTGKDRLFGGAGRDTLSGGAHGDHLDGGAGDDRLHGGPGADRIAGNSGNDTLAGEAGADRLFAHAGDDVLLGGAGADQLHGLNGNDTLSGHRDRDTLDGGNGNDRLAGGFGADRLGGGPGDDLLFGEAGDDWLSGGPGADVLYGGDGGDLLVGHGGADRLHGGSGGDRLAGGFGADRLSGGAGDDVLFGEAGDDWLNGGPGADRLHGGAGNDTFVFTGGGTVADFSAGDRIGLPAGLTLADARQAGADVVFALPGGHAIVLEGTVLASLDADMFV